MAFACPRLLAHLQCAQGGLTLCPEGALFSAPCWSESRGDHGGEPGRKQTAQWMFVRKGQPDRKQTAQWLFIR